MKIRILLFLLCTGIAASGCKKDNPVDSKPPPVKADSITYQIKAYGIQDMRQGESLVLWIKMGSNNSWQKADILKVRYRFPDDSVSIVGKFFAGQPLDSLNDVLISLEHTSAPSAPELPIAGSGTLVLDSAKSNLTGMLDSRYYISDYSSLHGGLVFTSPLPDSTAYTHEFYLMNIQGSSQSPSLLSLSVPQEGWKYGLWAFDLNFTPHQYFLYGLFSAPQGYDSDSANDHYPFPGGWKPQQMNVPSGSIVVTLEPEIYGDSLKFKGPSSFKLLQFDRFKFIEKDKNYPMTNVSSHSLPGGTILFRRS